MTDITLPDGTSLNNVPIGSTYNDVAVKAGGKYGTKAWLGNNNQVLSRMPKDPLDMPPIPQDKFFGPKMSGMIRPFMKGPAEAINMLGPTELVWLLNKAGVKPESIGASRTKEGKIESPNEYVKRLIDQFTTVPTDAATKLIEDVDAMALGGAIGPNIPQWVRKLLPQASQAARKLAQRGVTMTPGQIYGKSVGWLEEQLAKIHPAPKFARGKAIEQWNKAELNDALKTAGAQPIPKDVPAGFDANNFAKTQFNQRYAEVLAKLKVNVGQDADFNRALTNARALYARARSPTATNPPQLDERSSAILRDIIDNKVWGEVSRSGEASAQKMKQIESTLREEAEKLENSGDYYERKLASVLYGLRNEFKAMVVRQNPGVGEELARVDQGYAGYKLASKASVKSTVREGVYTPGQRLQAIKERDTSLDKDAFGRGAAFGQQEAREAQQVLGNKLPDSGTPGGMAALETGKAIAGLTAGYELGHPAAALGLIAGPAAGYTQPVLRGVQNLILGNPASALGAVGNQFSTLGAAGVAIGEGMMPLMSDPTQDPLAEFGIPPARR